MPRPSLFLTLVVSSSLMAVSLGADPQHLSAAVNASGEAARADAACLSAVVEHDAAVRDLSMKHNTDETCDNTQLRSCFDEENNIKLKSCVDGKREKFKKRGGICEVKIDRFDQLRCLKEHGLKTVAEGCAEACVVKAKEVAERPGVYAVVDTFYPDDVLSEHQSVVIRETDCDEKQACDNAALISCFVEKDDTKLKSCLDGKAQKTFGQCRISKANQLLCLRRHGLAAEGCAEACVKNAEQAVRNGHAILHEKYTKDVFSNHNSFVISETVCDKRV